MATREAERRKRNAERQELAASQGRQYPGGGVPGQPDRLGAVADELADLIAQFPAAIWAQRGEIQPGGIRR